MSDGLDVSDYPSEELTDLLNTLNSNVDAEYQSYSSSYSSKEEYLKSAYKFDSRIKYKAGRENKDLYIENLIVCYPQLVGKYLAYFLFRHQPIFSDYEGGCGLKRKAACG